jgi:Glu-tRNA(Gln) amidotransferase subunit E-like FAD-binding protein
MRHFEVMTLPGGDGVAIEDVRVTLADLRAAIRGSQRAHKAARFRASALGSAPHSEKYDEKVQSAVPPAKLTGGMQDVLERMRSSLEEEQIPTRAIFEAFDSDKDGKLDASEVKDMVWRLLPTLDADQVRMALAHIFEHASAEENEISFSDFAADAIAAGEDPGKKRGTVSFRTFDTAIKALQLGREEEDS